MNRIYHPYWLWEDYKAGFYENVSGKEKNIFSDKVFEMFNSQSLTLENMFYVVDNWNYSMQHNLSNSSMNKIAYIGQSACCNYAGNPYTVTMEVWSKLDKKIQLRANKDALKALERWNNNNKIIQLCLSLD